jgi:benzoylformate decarboxylase
VSTGTTVRDASFEVLRACGMLDIFANPGSTEVPFLVDLPADLRFVLALHEASVVGLATGHALATGQPAFVLLHSTPGLGNAVNALATARVNRAPLVVVTGQQDRRHVALEPFLAGRLDGLAGSYPVWVGQPAIAQDVPAAIRRAWHEASYRRGPALVVVPMDDWRAQTAEGLGLAAPAAVRRPAAADDTTAAEIAGILDGARSPALVVGSEADDPETWRALTALVERLGCPVWQEAFGARAGFPQDHPQFAGHLPTGRSGLRTTLAPYDVVLVVGAAAFRQYLYEPGPLVQPGTTVVVVSDDADTVHHSHAELGVVADPGGTCARLAQLVERRGSAFVAPVDRAEEPSPTAGDPLRATQVFTALAARLPADVVLVEETPSSRPDLHRLLPARAPRGFVSAAMGGLGFALPAAAGLRMGDPTRPVVAVVGDGSSLYGIHALWSAARYECGVLFVVLSNGGYAVMDQLAEAAGGKPPWPAFEDVDVAGLATSLGCPAVRIGNLSSLVETLDEVVPSLARRREPLLLDVRVSPDDNPGRRPS